jgi:hypothetical protein
MHTELTLRSSFRPKINPSPLHPPRSPQLRIHDLLYNYKDIYQNNKQALSKNLKSTKNPFTPKSNLQSDAIVEQTIAAKISQFFETIDHHCNGVITADDCENWVSVYQVTNSIF